MLNLKHYYDSAYAVANWYLVIQTFRDDKSLCD